MPLLPLLHSCPPLRKKKAVHKTTSTDDKRLQSTLKRLGVNTIPGIEEVRSPAHLEAFFSGIWKQFLPACSN